MKIINGIGDYKISLSPKDKKGARIKVQYVIHDPERIKVVFLDSLGFCPKGYEKWYSLEEFNSTFIVL